MEAGLFFFLCLWSMIVLNCLENSPPEKSGLLKSSFGSGVFCYFVGHFRYIVRILKWERGGKIVELHEWKILLHKSETFFLNPQGFRGKCYTVLSWGYLKRNCYKVVQLWKSPSFSGEVSYLFSWHLVQFHNWPFTSSRDNCRCQTNVCWYSLKILYGLANLGFWLLIYF